MNLRTQHGATLIELVIAIVIVTAAAGTIVGLLATMSRNSADAMVETQSAVIANAYLNEILAFPIADPNGPDIGRANADNIDDYLNLPDTVVRNRYGVAVPNMGNYSVTVAIAQTAIDGPGVNDVPAADTRLVTVTVTGPFGENTMLSGFKSRHPL